MMNGKILDILQKAKDAIFEVMAPELLYAAIYNPSNTQLRFPIMIIDGQDKKNAFLPRFLNDGQNGFLPDLLIHKEDFLYIDSGLMLFLENRKVRYWPEQFAQGSGPKIWCGAGLRGSEGPIGFIVAEMKNTDKIGRANDFFRTIAQTASLKIEDEISNSKIRITKDKLERKIDDLRAVQEIGRELTSSMGLTENQILTRLYQKSKESLYRGRLNIIDQELSMYIALYDPVPGKMDIVDADQPENSQFFGEIRFPLMYVDGKWAPAANRRVTKGAFGRTEMILSTKKGILSKTKKDSHDFYKKSGHKEFIGKPMASWIGAPMITMGNKVIGVIATYHQESEYLFDDDDLEVLSLMANQAAVALENSRQIGMLESLNSALIETNKELSDKNEELKYAQIKISEAEAVVTRTGIATDFVHKISNLVGTTPVWLGLAKERLREIEVNDQKLWEYLTKVNEDTVRLMKHAKRLDKPPTEERVDVIEMLAALIRQLKIQTPPNIQIVTAYEDEKGLFVHAFKSELKDAIWNILENGIEAMEDHFKNKDSLSIKTTKQISSDRSFIAIEISDTGKGIPEKDRKDIFSPFRSSKEGHMGYGLWRAKNIVENIGGELFLTEKQQPEKGECFVIRLPLNEEEHPNG